MINPNTPFLTPDGRVTREWLMFFYALSNAIGGVNSQPDLTSLISTMDENFSETIEIEKTVDALRSALALDDALCPRLAELGKSLDAMANSQADGQVSLIAEAQKALADVQVQLACYRDVTAMVAELARQINDLAVAVAFTPGTHEAMGVIGNTTSTAPAAGSGAALPATPAGYVTLNINGKPHQFPYY